MDTDGERAISVRDIMWSKNVKVRALYFAAQSDEFFFFLSLAGFTP